MDSAPEEIFGGEKDASRHIELPRIVFSRIFVDGVGRSTILVAQLWKIVARKKGRGPDSSTPKRAGQAASDNGSKRQQ
jgi:hypothetical protein